MDNVYEFKSMNKKEFNNSVKIALKNTDKKICYLKVENEVYQGGMVKSLNEALHLCYEFYMKNAKCDLGICDYSGYSGHPMIWSKQTILYELGIISDSEYNKYLDSINIED